NAVIVDRAFADEIAAGGNVVGRRIRRRITQDGVTTPDEWLEIVGVVPAFTPPPPFEVEAPKFYRPLTLGGTSGPLQLAVRTRRGAPPAELLTRVREVARSVDPALRVAQLTTAADAERLLGNGSLSVALGISALSGGVLLLSAAGIYARMSFTVAGRRREIGIRAALGAAPRQVLSDVFRRAGAQLGAGVIAGLAFAELVAR